jgi:DNA invertase Pin-like site-specific DNA recombinase
MSMDAIIYAAKSTEDRKDSIGGQLDAIRKAIAAEGDREVIGEHSDENISGFRKSRGPELEAAIERAKAVAPSELWCFDPDRLARGNGVEARHLGKLYFDLLEAGVKIRAVSGDDDLKDPIRAVLRGERNTQDSASKSMHTKRGLKDTVAGGQWRGGILPGGYEAQHEVDARGRVTRWLVKHPEDAAHYDLIWRLAEGGASGQRIALELGRRGAATRPVRKRMKHKSGPKAGMEVDYAPQPFTANRVSQVLTNPFYAGLQTYKGETFEGDWPTYVDIATFERLKAERKHRSHAEKRLPGRPPHAYLLSGLARCAVCGGPMQGCGDRARGTRSYACGAHREFHKDSDDWCYATAFDAAKVDGAVLSNIGTLLKDADSLREQLDAGRRAERDDIERIAAEASKAAQVAESSAERATAEFADAEDPEERALLKDAAKVKRAEAKRERSRADAALDALNQPSPEASDRAVMDRLWETLSGAVADAGEDVKILNAALRETFDRFELRRNGDGFMVVPYLSVAAAKRALREAGVPTVATVPSLSEDGTLGLPAFVG